MTFLAGQIVRAADLNDADAAALAAAAKGIIGRTVEDTDQLVANANTEFLVGTVSCTIEADRFLKVAWHGNISSSLAADTIIISIFDEDESTTGVCIGQARAYIGANNAFVPGSIEVSLDSNDYSTGLHTFYLYARRAAGGGTGGYVADPTYPSDFVVEDMGPS